MFKADYVLMAIASGLLLSVNWLAFHDVREPHTVRDWVMLVASVLVLVYFARASRKPKPSASVTDTYSSPADVRLR